MHYLILRRQLQGDCARASDSGTPLDGVQTQRVNPSLEPTQQGGRQTASELWP